MNYNCPCCQFPFLGPGRYVLERPFFKDKLLEQTRFDVCRNCKTSFTAHFRVGKSNEDYLPVEISNILVPENVLRLINDGLHTMP